MKHLSVVAAVFHEGRKVFVTQRGYGEFKGRWEFPGGKIEVGESAETALRREIHEELSSDLTIECSLGSVSYAYSTFSLTMEVFLVHLENGTLTLNEAEDAKWVDVEDLPSIDFLPPDRMILPAISSALLAFPKP
ncbi:MAG: (deoxy)nucleoside triphosphate pyrophosphohydrolase [Erysipelotrichaceae bacterium]|nr:(deoxy)nucleoside triphosphate pyrophosphohydrolase [Erysipelotrichaceae bacterium]